MKRSNKVLLLTGLATITIGVAGILHSSYIQKPEINATTIKAYNHRPTNILDNLFEKDNVKYLPFIFNNSDERVTKDKVVSEFTRKGLTVTSISTGNKIATGTQIRVRENSNVYTVVIYGDVDGDGEVSVFDAQACVDDFVNNGKNLTGAYKIAANVENNDNEVDVFDAQRVVDFYVGTTTKLVIKEPTSVTETDTVAPVMSIGGQVAPKEQTIRIKVGDNYTDPVVTAYDNVDGNITANIRKSGSVNVNQEGTYNVTYTVSDTRGNTTTIKIIVIVEKKNEGGGPVIDQSGLATVELKAQSDVILHLQEVDSIITRDPSDGLIYTEIPVTFKDKAGNTMTNVTESKLNDLSIVLPEMKVGDTVKENGIKWKYGATNGNIDRIRFALSDTNAKWQALDENAKIILKVGQSEVVSLPVKINYTTPSSFDIEESTKLTAVNGTYTVKKDVPFTIGTITLAEGTTPIEIGTNGKNIETTITNSKGEEVTDGIEINYSYNENGEVLVQGTVSKIAVDNIEELYQVTIQPKGIAATKSFNIRAVNIPEDFSVELIKNGTTDIIQSVILSSENQYAEKEKIVIKSNNTEVTDTRDILFKYITFTLEVNEEKITEGSDKNIYLLFQRRDIDSMVIEEDEDEASVKYITVKKKINAPEQTIKVTATFFKGCGEDLERNITFDVEIRN